MKNTKNFLRVAVVLATALFALVQVSPMLSMSSSEEEAAQQRLLNENLRVLKASNERVGDLMKRKSILVANIRAMSGQLKSASLEEEAALRQELAEMQKNVRAIDAQLKFLFGSN